MANLILTIGVTVLSFCVVVFFVIAFANVVESVIAKHDMKRIMKDDVQIVKATEHDCRCCHECCGCQECYHSHDVESVHDEEE